MHGLVKGSKDISTRKNMKGLYVKDRKWRPEGGEWEPQNSFKTLVLGSNHKPQEANINTVMTTTREKGGSSLGTQLITIKRADRAPNQ
jgi:hypothetical protein